MIGQIKITGNQSSLFALKNAELKNNIFAGTCELKNVISTSKQLMLNIETQYELNTVYLTNISDKYHVDIEYTLSDHNKNTKYSGIVVYDKCVQHLGHRSDLL